MLFALLLLLPHEGVLATERPVIGDAGVGPPPPGILTQESHFGDLPEAANSST
jgi:hypothetical protein